MRPPGLPAVVAAAIVLTVVALVAFGPLGNGELRYTDVPVLALALPEEAAQQPTVPQVAAAPRVGVLLTEVGASTELGDAALRMPPAVGLVISTYADDPGGWLARARAAGHEAYLEAPLQAVRPELVDRGPMTLAPAQDATEGEKRLRWLLDRAAGFSGLAAEAGAFAAAPADAEPLLRGVHDGGMVMVELGAAALRQTADAVGARFLPTLPPLDAPPVADAVEAALGEIEAAALRTGAAAGWARARPRTLEHLRAWIATLDGKGLVLTAPASLAQAPP